MTKKTKPADLGGGKRPAGNKTKIHYQHNNKSINSNQSVPVPGTALCAFLKRYRNELLERPCSLHISALVDCCNTLLEEAGVAQ